MRKLFILILALGFSAQLSAQNFQFHYDFGEDRDYVTTTFEMFKLDEYGATFWFVDMDYNNRHDGFKSASLSYLEIARYINLPWVEGLSATLQYNDGLVGGFPLGPIWLAGGSYPVSIGNFTINTDLLYRHAYNSDAPDVQLTAVWFHPFLDGKISFAGFLDIWTQDDFVEDGKEFVLLTEPQLWYNFGDHLSLGTELEISKNFLPATDDLELMPTLGMKWQF
ncbi:MAG: DUF5020 family protein [Candidatus Marinimicrobia bacterium]|nr:DUF5020 family protein [Candidatus Neomarinimicrobiota bacterium]MCF7827520.1 DUF5020 family protein [Candidatus Neomarinimicrobiota bacterium]MCF7881618.1 DUF5020 family protein [Candidatus Neomarinimicrobiota bacterium]